LINEQLFRRVGFINPDLYEQLIFEADVTPTLRAEITAVIQLSAAGTHAQD
jgi:hypothetical protein